MQKASRKIIFGWGRIFYTYKLYLKTKGKKKKKEQINSSFNTLCGCKGFICTTGIPITRTSKFLSLYLL